MRPGEREWPSSRPPVFVRLGEGGAVPGLLAMLAAPSQPREGRRLAPVMAAAAA